MCGLVLFCQDGVDENGPQQQLGRLRYFTAHVKNTTDRMEQAKAGSHHYTSAQLDMLEVFVCIMCMDENMME